MKNQSRYTPVEEEEEDILHLQPNSDRQVDSNKNNPIPNGDVHRINGYVNVDGNNGYIKIDKLDKLDKLEKNEDKSPRKHRPILHNDGDTHGSHGKQVSFNIEQNQ